jgi:hypothetical protein
MLWKTKMNNDFQTDSQDDSIRSVMTIYVTVQGLLLILFFGAAPFIFFHAPTNRLRISQDQAVGIVELILPIFTGYIGMILGFYFGTREPK